MARAATGLLPSRLLSLNLIKEPHMRWFTSSLRRFREDQSGTLIAEAVIVLPMMLWAYLAMFVYWDAYRSINSAKKRPIPFRT